MLRASARARRRASTLIKSMQLVDQRQDFALVSSRSPSLPQMYVPAHSTEGSRRCLPIPARKLILTILDVLWHHSDKRPLLRRHSLNCEPQHASLETFLMKVLTAVFQHFTESSRTKPKVTSFAFASYIPSLLSKAHQ